MIKAFYSKSVHSCFSECYFPQPTITSSLSDTNILGILFSYILNLRLFVSVTDHISHPYIIPGKITVSYTLLIWTSGRDYHFPCVLNVLPISSSMIWSYIMKTHTGDSIILEYDIIPLGSSCPSSKKSWGLHVQDQAGQQFTFIQK